MNRIIIITLLLFNVSCQAQNEFKFDYENFDSQFLSYKAIQNPNITNKDFEFGNMILKETKIAIKNDPENFYVADYLNILSAFLTLKESKENINVAFRKFKDAEGSCQYFIQSEKTIEKDSKYDIIRKDYIKELEKCKSKTVVEKEFDITEYCKTNSLDLTLVEGINKIKIKDQKERYNEKVQNELDKENQVKIDSLYKEHKTYIGKTLVGNEFKDVMFLVIQHSNLEYMEKYLPIVVSAVSNGDLDEIPLKYLIDRIYYQKYNYQIFGSQGNLNMASELIINQVKKEYNIE